VAGGFFCFFFDGLAFFACFSVELALAIASRLIAERTGWLYAAARSGTRMQNRCSASTSSVARTRRNFEMV
jgi:hypothetical protein